MKRTISGCIGKGSIFHNNRSFFAENVDSTKTKDNIILCNENIKNVYHELFDNALNDYNAKQKRKDRIIKNYYEHISRSKQEKTFYEVIFQIGNTEDTHCKTAVADTAIQILKEFEEKFKIRNPHIRIFNSVIHLDEDTPHLHIDFIPFATEQNRGLSTRNSLTKALEQQGFKAEGKLNTSSKLWIDSEKKALSDIMKKYGISWEQKNTHESHLSVLDYKKKMRSQEIIQLEDKIEKSTAVLSEQSVLISEKESVLKEYDDKILEISEVVADIKAVDNIEIKNKLFSDKVSIYKSDYENLSSTAKKYALYISKEEELSNENKALQSENARLENDVVLLHDEVNQTMTALSEWKDKFIKMKDMYNDLLSKFNKAMKFIDEMGLMETLKKFLHPERYKENEKNIPQLKTRK